MKIVKWMGKLLRKGGKRARSSDCVGCCGGVTPYCCRCGACCFDMYSEVEIQIGTFTKKSGLFPLEDALAQSAVDNFSGKTLTIKSRWRYYIEDFLYDEELECPAEAFGFWGFSWLMQTNVAYWDGQFPYGWWLVVGFDCLNKRIDDIRISAVTGDEYGEDVTGAPPSEVSMGIGLDGDGYFGTGLTDGAQTCCFQSDAHTLNKGVGYDWFNESTLAATVSLKLNRCCSCEVDSESACAPSVDYSDACDEGEVNTCSLFTGEEANCDDAP